MQVSERLDSLCWTDHEGSRRAQSAATSGLPAADAESWPIGLVVAANWVAHQTGPEPTGHDLIEAVGHGLVELGNSWTLTEQGRAALSTHGWL
jgi:hypothetical protein